MIFEKIKSTSKHKGNAIIQNGETKIMINIEPLNPYNIPKNHFRFFGDKLLKLHENLNSEFGVENHVGMRRYRGNFQVLLLCIF